MLFANLKTNYSCELSIRSKCAICQDEEEERAQSPIADREMADDDLDDEDEAVEPTAVTRRAANADDRQNKNRKKKQKRRRAKERQRSAAASAPITAGNDETGEKENVADKIDIEIE